MADVEKSQTEPVAIFKKRANKANTRKRPATPPPDESDLSSEYSSEDESGQRIKRRRKNGVIIVASARHKTDTESLHASAATADNSATITNLNDATKQSNWYDEAKEGGLYAKQLLGNTRKQQPESEGAYRGAANYTTFIQKNPDAPQRAVGPIKAPTNIRTITVTDFAPDVCKDYKQTGFCGFGDSCKFLHAREDYKQGWELDRDWEVGTKGKKMTGTTIGSANRKGKASDADDDDEALLESIPFACFICKEHYKNPIVTKCGHYFCEKCALDRYRKTPNCAACGAGTNGVFNGAKNLKRLLERKKERERRRKEKAKEEGEEVSDSNEEE